jgi:hypothetical protein
MIRPAVPSDFDLFKDRPPARVKAWALEHAGQVLGVGGLIALPDGKWAGFLDLMPGVAKRYPKTLHQAACTFLKQQKRQGIRRITATADLDASPAAERWLIRLGFREVQMSGMKVFIWQDQSQPQP